MDKAWSVHGRVASGTQPRPLQAQRSFLQVLTGIRARAYTQTKQSVPLGRTHPLAPERKQKTKNKKDQRFSTIHMSWSHFISKKDGLVYHQEEHPNSVSLITHTSPVAFSALLQ